MQFKIWRNDGAFYPHLATRLAAVTDGYVGLILLWQLQARRVYGVDNSRWLRKDKFGMVSEICNRQKNA